VNLILVVSVSLVIGKSFFVVEPFAVLYNFICHLAMLWSLACWNISLLGILLKAISWFLTVSFASLSASSFPYFLAWALFQVYMIVQLHFSNAISFFLISSMR
jgi:hypothetical protein